MNQLDIIYLNGKLPLETTTTTTTTGLPGVGFKLTADGDYDIQIKRLIKVKPATALVDAVSMRQLSRYL